MTDLNRRIEQSILEYRSRRAYLDEMLERAKAGLVEAPANVPEKTVLVELQHERDRLGMLYEKLRFKSVANWREEEIEISGPMAIWDVVAQKLENLLERIGK
jgi:hypothetical protein